MKPFTYLFFGVCLGLIGFFGYLTFSGSSSAQKVVRTQWEYCAITSAYSFNPAKNKLNKIYGMAEICFLQNTGCKRLEIKHEMDYGLYLQERALLESFQTRQDASQKAAEIAFQKAMSQLGNEGWEIVSQPDLKFEYVNLDDYNKFEDKSVLFERNDTKAVYFKRLKTQ